MHIALQLHPSIVLFLHPQVKTMQHFHRNLRIKLTLLFHLREVVGTKLIEVFSQISLIYFPIQLISWQTLYYLEIIYKTLHNALEDTIRKFFKFGLLLQLYQILKYDCGFAFLALQFYGFQEILLFFAIIIQILGYIFGVLQKIRDYGFVVDFLDFWVGFVPAGAQFLAVLQTDVQVEGRKGQILATALALIDLNSLTMFVIPAARPSTFRWALKTVHSSNYNPKKQQKLWLEINGAIQIIIFIIVLKPHKQKNCFPLNYVFLAYSFFLYFFVMYFINKLSFYKILTDSDRQKYLFRKSYAKRRG